MNTWLLLGGGAALLYYISKQQTVGQAAARPVLPQPPAAKPFDIMDIVPAVGAKLKDFFAGSSTPKYTKAQLAVAAKELEGYTSELGADHGTLGGGTYGSLS